MLALLAQGSEGGGSTLFAFLPLLLMGGVFYFLLIRPQQRRARAQQALLQSVEVGDEIVTTAGVFGTVTEIDDDRDVVTVEIAPGTSVRMIRAGISRVVADDDEDLSDDDDDLAEHDAVDDPRPGPEVPDGQDGPFRQT
jgi:preprotein translocase subunit YajC